MSVVLNFTDEKLKRGQPAPAQDVRVLFALHIQQLNSLQLTKEDKRHEHS